MSMTQTPSCTSGDSLDYERVLALQSSATTLSPEEIRRINKILLFNNNAILLFETSIFVF